MVTEILQDSGRREQKLLKSYQLRVTSGEGHPEVVLGGAGPLRVGSAEGNDLVLRDPTVSRIHFEILREERGIFLRDLESRNGTFVDDLQVTGAYLRPQARIRVGRNELSFDASGNPSEVELLADSALGPLLGKSEVMRALFATILRISGTKTTVLLEGESGTGKELIARALHASGPRAKGPFVVFDCSAIPPNLVESELFGHERGAFTGAHAARAGRFEEAHGGTLFLDEIGELTTELQPKLLRVLESREVRRVGGDQLRSVDVRVVSATNRDLAAEVNRSAFRVDLYYRLAVVRLAVPPLRARLIDLPLLVEHFGAMLLGPEGGRALVSAISAKSWHELNNHAWRGNVRELKNAVERSIALAGDALPTQIELYPGPLLPKASSDVLRSTEAGAPEGLLLPAVDLERGFTEQKNALVAAFEEKYLRALLERHGSNISRAASAAGLDRMHFKRLMRKYALGSEG